MDDELALAYAQEIENSKDFLIPAEITPLSDDELLARKLDDEKLALKELQKQAILNSAIRKLSKLGLTEPEARAVIGLD